jgi:hypothetical protein
MRPLYLRVGALLCLIVCSSGCFVSVKRSGSAASWTQQNIGGMYDLQVESSRMGTSSSSISTSDDGAGNVTVDADIQEGNHRIQIKAGMLLVNGNSCGELKRGDAIKVFGNGSATVNGEKR